MMGDARVCPGLATPMIIFVFANDILEMSKEIDESARVNYLITTLSVEIFVNVWSSQACIQNPLYSVHPYKVQHKHNK